MVGIKGEKMNNFNIIDTLYMIFPILTAMSFHEYSHAWVANKLGDPTAEIQGRLTLNPIKHIDIFGFLMLIVAGFGWANPVPFNPNNFKNRKSGTLLVAIAGPISNFILAFIFAFALKYVAIPLNNLILYYIFLYGVTINVGFGIFNLLPLPPLDGSKILASILPEKIEILFYRYEKYIYFLIILLAFTGAFSYILDPIYKPIIQLLAKFIQS